MIIKFDIQAELDAIEKDIDRIFGPGYARQHPEIIAAALRSRLDQIIHAELAERIRSVDNTIEKGVMYLVENRAELDFSRVESGFRSLADSLDFVATSIKNKG